MHPHEVLYQPPQIELNGEATSAHSRRVDVSDVVLLGDVQEARAQWGVIEDGGLVEDGLVGVLLRCVLNRRGK
jgi:hypothetical protein